MTANGFDRTDDTDGVIVCDIGDPDDARLDNFRDLNSIDRRPDLPSGKGLVIAEGVLVVQRMLASPFTPLAFLGTDRRLAELTADLAGNPAPYYRVSAEVMARVIGFHLNRGVLAAARRAPERSIAQLVDGARTVAVLEGVNDHENLGAIFRNAAGLGVAAHHHAVIGQPTGAAPGLALLDGHSSVLSTPVTDDAATTPRKIRSPAWRAVRAVSGLDEASAWLRSHRPHWWKPGLSHGDYQFANVMFDRSVPSGLAAIIDWEMALPGVGRMTSAELLQVVDGVIVRGELIYDGEALRRAMAQAAG